MKKIDLISLVIYVLIGIILGSLIGWASLYEDAAFVNKVSFGVIASAIFTCSGEMLKSLFTTKRFNWKLAIITALVSIFVCALFA